MIYTRLNFYQTTQFFQDDRELVMRSARAPHAWYEPNHQWHNSPLPLCLVFIFTQHLIFLSVFSAVMSCALYFLLPVMKKVFVKISICRLWRKKHYKTIKCNVSCNIFEKLLFWWATFLSGLSKTGLFFAIIASTLRFNVWQLCKEWNVMIMQVTTFGTHACLKCVF